jgi:hypothetical protein
MLFSLLNRRTSRRVSAHKTEAITANKWPGFKATEASDGQRIRMMPMNAQQIKSQAIRAVGSPVTQGDKRAVKAGYR